MGEGVSRTNRAAALGGSRRTRLVAAVLTFAAAAPGPVVTAVRAETPPSAEEAARKLEQQNSDLAAKEARDRAIQKDLTSIAD